MRICASLAITLWFVSCQPDTARTPTSGDLDSLDGAPVLVIIFMDLDQRQYAFAARARWDRAHLSVDPVPSGPTIAVHLDPDEPLPIVKLTAEVRDMFLEQSQNLEPMKQLIARSQFALWFRGDSVPAGAIHVPRFLGYTRYQHQ